MSYIDLHEVISDWAKSIGPYTVDEVGHGGANKDRWIRYRDVTPLYLINEQDIYDPSFFRKLEIELKKRSKECFWWWLGDHMMNIITGVLITIAIAAIVMSGLM
jgi:hypothetical protein